MSKRSLLHFHGQFELDVDHVRIGMDGHQLQASLVHPRHALLALPFTLCIAHFSCHAESFTARTVLALCDHLQVRGPVVQRVAADVVDDPVSAVRDGEAHEAQHRRMRRPPNFLERNVCQMRRQRSAFRSAGAYCSAPSHVGTHSSRVPSFSVVSVRSSGTSSNTNFLFLTIAFI